MGFQISGASKRDNRNLKAHVSTPVVANARPALSIFPAKGRDTYNGRIRSSYGSKPLDPALASPVGVRCHIALRPQYWIEIRLNKLFAGGKVDASSSDSRTPQTGSIYNGEGKRDRLKDFFNATENANLIFETKSCTNGPGMPQEEAKGNEAILKLKSKDSSRIENSSIR
ncbi:hypothetical protein CEXT_764651 [Caerostris extrusa]|uniref:Uncharacterized protein n=1 Tax=Caerostris extrusa TaxID=172846 RepID=A0AAV4N3Z0_CAEEX|nr:hypothetical protein CEXT_764651 [Caerostris extrusa]